MLVAVRGDDSRFGNYGINIGKKIPTFSSFSGTAVSLKLESWFQYRGEEIHTLENGSGKNAYLDGPLFIHLCVPFLLFCLRFFG